MRINPSLLIAIGILIFVAYVVLIGVNPSELLKVTMRATPLYYFLAILVDINFIFFYGIAWFFLVRCICDDIKLKDALVIVIIGWFGDMLIPAAFMTGEALRLYLLKKLYNIEYTKGLATVVMHRVLSAIAFAMFVTLGLTFLVEGGKIISNDVIKRGLFAISLAIIVILVGLVLVFKIDLIEEWSLKGFMYLARSFKRFRLEMYQEKVLSLIKSYKESVNLLKERSSNILVGFVFLITQWSLGVAIPYIFFMAVGFRMSYWALATAYPIYGLADNIPVGIPVNAGVLDVAMTSMFILLGAPKEVAVTVTLLTRSIIVTFEAVFTGIITAIYSPKYFEDFSLDFLKELIQNTSKFISKEE